MRKATVIIMAILMLLLCSCGKKDNVASDLNATAQQTDATATEPVADMAELTSNTIKAEIKLKTGESIKLELYPDLAPKTVKNFVKNVEDGFYDGTIFHRVIDGFMIQGGGFDTDYEPKRVDDTVEGEFSKNGHYNDLSHKRGVISMARSSEMNSASTQFFIVQEDSEYLDGQYAGFGMVTDGMEVVDQIAASPKMSTPPAGFSDVPQQQVIIESVSITK